MKLTIVPATLAFLMVIPSIGGAETEVKAGQSQQNTIMAVVTEAMKEVESELNLEPGQGKCVFGFGGVGFYTQEARVQYPGSVGSQAINAKAIPVPPDMQQSDGRLIETFLVTFNDWVKSREFTGQLKAEQPFKDGKIIAVGYCATNNIRTDFRLEAVPISEAIISPDPNDRHKPIEWRRVLDINMQILFNGVRFYPGTGSPESLKL